jgi:hypothetical protein
MMRQARRAAAGAALLLSSGCLATQGNMQALQGEIRASSAAALLRDSLNRVRLEAKIDSVRREVRDVASATARTDRVIAVLSDSLRRLSDRFDTFRVATIEQFRAVNENMQVMENVLREMSRSTVNLRADLDASRRGIDALCRGRGPGTGHDRRGRRGRRGRPGAHDAPDRHAGSG